ncbi:hypothetical protein ACFU44_00720 [Nocardia rhizosphaerihabitans]|uniref:hypothetical protein n=1 Tax=Nocardia rhizosphaerihabitans TaxID=1691570 RepID=UPI00366FB6AB
MEPTTRELFELAEIYYTEMYNNHPEVEKYPDTWTWDKLPPALQAIKADAMKKVIQEWEGNHFRLLVPDDRTESVTLNDESGAMHFYPATRTTVDPFKEREREWKRLEDVPNDLMVRDQSGFIYQFIYGEWKWRSYVGAWMTASDGYRGEGPFVEWIYG